MSPNAIAERVAALVIERDAASAMLGIRCDSVAPGQSVCSMAVENQHLNGHGICHGGFLFTLADTAFAIACNSYNQNAVAQHNNITFIAPGQAGTHVTASATEVSRTGRNGVYDVTVTDDSGTVLALFRGASRTIRGRLFEESER